MSEDPAPFVTRALIVLLLVAILAFAVRIVAAAGNVVLIILAAVLFSEALSAPTGAFLAVAPAIAIAIPEGPVKVGLVVALFLVVQTLEGNVLTPLLHASAGDIPPALQLAAQLLFATVAGPLGLALATPILIVLVVAVRALYVEDILGDVVGDPSCLG